MDQPSQDRYRPVIENRLAAIEATLAELSPRALAATSYVGEYAPAEVPSAAASPQLKPLLEQRLRLQLALQRIDGGYFGRCMRCGKDLTRVQLDQDPTALTCSSDCRPRRR